MGLDQYLKKKLYVKRWNHSHDHSIYEITVTRGGGMSTSVNPARITHIEEEVGYWRKANHIHQWFVENVQGGNDDCREYYVDYDKLTELLDICKRVKEDPSLAEELLPTQDGFFFGSTEYDEWYMQGIEHTIEILEPLLQELDAAKETEEYPDVYYESSW
jgi:hypothetical protein